MKGLLRARGVLPVVAALLVAGGAGLAYVAGFIDQLTPIDQLALAFCGVAALGCFGLLGGEGRWSLDGSDDGGSSDCSGEGSGD
ncbi:MAG: hypothetical protein R3D68_20330 [Hyphomicrobiaceae bacterium]